MRAGGYDAGLRVEFEFSNFRDFEFSSGLEGGGNAAMGLWWLEGAIEDSR